MSICIERKDAEYIIGTIRNAITMAGREPTKRKTEVISAPRVRESKGGPYDATNEDVEYYKLLISFNKKLLSCGNELFVRTVSNVIPNTIMVLEKMFECSNVLPEDEKSREINAYLLNASTSYQKRLVDILNYRPEADGSIGRLMRAFNVTDKRSEFCVGVLAQLQQFYRDLNRDLSRYNLTSSTFINPCGFMRNGKFVPIEKIIRTVNYYAKEIIDDYYTMYNGYIFYAYIAGAPVPKSVIRVVRMMFYYAGSMLCGLASSGLASLFFTIRKTFAGSSEEMIAMLNQQIDKTSLLESLIKVICKSLYMFSGRSKLSASIIRDITGLLNQRERYLTRYQPVEEKTAMKQFVDKIETKIMGRVPRPIRGFIEKQQRSGEFRSVVPALIPLALYTNMGTMTQLNNMVKYYNPFDPKKVAPQSLKNIWNMDWKEVIYREGKTKGKSYLVKFNKKTALLSSIYMAALYSEDLNYYLDQLPIYPKEYNEFLLSTGSTE